tara:strand:+ start:130 stop:411 length:282 start_codon:yes stop_codon:yes gene_type:complete
MKVTKSQLKEIIKEELAQNIHERSAASHPILYLHNNYVGELMDLYKKHGFRQLPDEVSSAVNGLVQILQQSIQDQPDTNPAPSPLPNVKGEQR